MAGLLQALAATDVVVTVQVTLARFRFAGDLRFLAAAGGCRYVLVRVSADQSPRDQIAVLGHELQHAAEVAAAPEVQDEAGLAALMRRIGRATIDGAFETDAAVQVAWLVRREVNRK